MPTLNATPARLRDNTWGARVRGAATVGDTITITSSQGKTWQAEVAAIVWSGNDRRDGRVALVRTRPLSQRAPARPGRYDRHAVVPDFVEHFQDHPWPAERDEDLPRLVDLVEPSPECVWADDELPAAPGGEEVW